MTYLRFNKYSVKRILIIEKRNYCTNKWIGVSVFNCRKRMILLWLTNDGSYRKELNSNHKACVKRVIQGRPWKQHLTEKMSAIRPPTALQQQIKAAITDCSSTLWASTVRRHAFCHAGSTNENVSLRLRRNCLTHRYQGPKLRSHSVFTAL